MTSFSFELSTFIMLAGPPIPGEGAIIPLVNPDGAFLINDYCGIDMIPPPPEAVGIGGNDPVPRFFMGRPLLSVYGC